MAVTEIAHLVLALRRYRHNSRRGGFCGSGGRKMWATNTVCYILFVLNRGCLLARSLSVEKLSRVVANIVVVGVEGKVDSNWLRLSALLRVTGMIIQCADKSCNQWILMVYRLLVYFCGVFLCYSCMNEQFVDFVAELASPPWWVDRGLHKRLAACGDHRTII